MQGLTKFPNGSVREILALSTPIFLAILSSYLMAFCDRWFLSKYSLEAFQGAYIGGYLALTFQAFCIRVTSINQIFISRAFGEKKEALIGPYTWQMIWGSLFLSLLILPLGLLVNYFYFSQTTIQSLGSQYFLIMMLGTCLFSVGGVFAAFQSGIGKTKTLVVAAIVSNVCNFVLNYILIFGVEGIVPPLGIKGAALGTIISQGIYCVILFIKFIKNKNALRYQNRKWRLSISLFWELIRVGFPRGLAKSFSLFYWVLAVKIVSQLEGDYLLMLSYGGALWLSLSAIGESLGKGLISLFSFFLGANASSLVWKTLRSALLILFVIFLLLGIPLILFSETLIQIVLQENLSSASLQILKLGSIWLWIYFFLEGLTRIAAGLIAAMKKTTFAMKFSLLEGGFSTVLPYYLCFSVFQCHADKVWMATWVCCLVTIFVYFRKATAEEKKEEYGVNQPQKLLP